MSEYPTPADASQLKTFLGMAGYYRRFVPNFAEVASPLYKLLNKGVKYEWSDCCEQSFQQLRSHMATSPALAFPDLNVPFELSGC